jgi:hypothetical protein
MLFCSDPDRRFYSSDVDVKDVAAIDDIVFIFIFFLLVIPLLFIGLLTPSS